MRNVSVLVIGDDDVSSALKTILNGDYSVSFGNMENDITEKVLETKPDLVILDVNTSGDLGRLRKLKENKNTVGVPVIVSVDREDEQCQEWAIELGAADCIEKPFKPVICGNRIIHFAEKIILQGMAYFDGLTEVHNRRSFELNMAKIWGDSARWGRNASVVMLDIDHFKQYNDTYGHLRGNKTLRKVAKAVEGATRDDDIVARYGGEEFAIILCEASLEEAMCVAERVRKAVENLGIVHETTGVEFAPGVGPRVTVTLGVASCLINEGLDTQELVDVADGCLYKAKKSGRNRVHGEICERELNSTRDILADMGKPNENVVGDAPVRAGRTFLPPMGTSKL